MKDKDRKICHSMIKQHSRKPKIKDYYTPDGDYLGSTSKWDTQDKKPENTSKKDTT